MVKEQNGVWVKYEKAPRKWHSKDSSYTRLYNDLKRFKNTGWNLRALKDDICGEFIPCDGTQAGDIYIYYLVDAKNGRRKPKLLLKAEDSCTDDKKTYVQAWGIKRRIYKDAKDLTYEIHADYLPVVLEKFIELDAKDWAIKDYNEKLKGYQDLQRVANEGVKTNADILTIYRNFGRTDTTLAHGLVKGRCVQDDYNALEEEEKIELVTILCKLDAKDLSRLAVLTNTEDALLEIGEINVLKGSVTPTGLRCLRYASDDIRVRKEKILEILERYDCFLKSSFVQCLPQVLQVDVQILQALVRAQPYELEFILRDIIQNKNGSMEKALQNRDFMRGLLQAHFENVLSNPKYINEGFTASDVLWHFSSNMLENVESEILYGPQPTKEQEEMKDKIRDAIVLERKQIREFEKANKS